MAECPGSVRELVQQIVGKLWSLVREQIIRIVSGVPVFVARNVIAMKLSSI